MLWNRILLLSTCSISLCLGLSPRIESRTTNGYRTVAYFVNWAIYGSRQFFPQELPADKLTHVLYAFANINPQTGEVYLSDLWADTDIRFAGDSNDTGINLYGCFKQLYLLKKKNRNLKILLSIGGSNYSSNFVQPASIIASRSTFAASAVSLVQNLGLDGLDINWENLTDDVQARNFILLLQAVRDALDVYGNSLDAHYHFTLSVACPAGPSNYEKLHLAEMDQYIDFWNLMAYDYAGSWSIETGHQANLFFTDNRSTPFNTQTAISYYIEHGIVASKIVLGMPIYGRAFENTKGLGTPFKGTGNGTWEAGIYDFKALPLAGATESFDVNSGTSYSYDATKGEFISYDNTDVAKLKAGWIQQMGLGGGMWWESSADAKGSESLIENVAGLLGGKDGSGLESSLNQLSYLNAVYANLRASMPGDNIIPVSPPTSSSSISGTSPATSAPSSTLLASSKCGTSFAISSPTSATFASLSSKSSTSCLCTSPTNSSSSKTLLASNTSTDFTSTSTSIRSASFVTKNTTITSITNSCSSILGSAFHSDVGSNTTTNMVYSQSLSRSSTDVAMVPGVNGVPGCAFVLASRLGAGALCASDYCNCGGTIAPLLTSSVSGTLKTDCNYRTQPAKNSCPLPSGTVTVPCLTAVYLPGENPPSTIVDASAIKSYVSHNGGQLTTWAICGL